VGRYLAPKFLALIVALALLLPGTVSAQAAPDDLIILSVQGYTGALEDDDLLLVVRYDIEYASPPSQLVNDTFIGRFLVDVTDKNSTELFPFSQRGYNQGLFSFYWTALQATVDSVEYNNPNSENYNIRLQGKPGVFPGGVPAINSSTITWRTRLELRTDIIALAQALQGDADWVTEELSLIVTGDQTRFTSDGEEYFATVIPRLASMEPALFESAVKILLPVTRTPANSYKEDLDDFWVGYWVDNNLQSIADNAQISLVVVKTFLAFVGMLIVCVGTAILLKQHGETAVEFGILTMAVTLPLGIAVGLVSMPVGMIIGLLALVGLSWSFFGRRGG
jgi:hypothetical protein